jgi:hypothetical protein
MQFEPTTHNSPTEELDCKIELLLDNIKLELLESWLLPLLGLD